MNINEENILNKQKSNFKLTFAFLEPEKKEAMSTLYNFCRITDDIVDDENLPEEIRAKNIYWWRQQVEKAIYNSSDYYLLNKFAQIVQKFNIPTEPIFDLIDGMLMDLEKKRYLNFDDLLLYCYRVASTVGLMTIQIIGYRNPSTKDYAINLGYAMQLTNIIRDVGEDAERNRIYLPLNDIEQFNVTEIDILNKKYDENMKNLLEFEANKALEFYHKADSFLDKNEKKFLYVARAMQHIYYALLKKIQKYNYNVFEKRIKVPSYEKLYYAFGTYFKYNILY
ncbi:MAG TPA: squalene/phytoene synthase family protein [Ignavibacteriales bacterium]|nr:squalene/phytoene synthase family protein [Ignavibacteriales bacterium]HOL81649.1 squalene/phytoene synthase family protein [Ignavibacteriales bacterium]HOM65170.1 squalene/phytoene synthase family protein [Ignavibacteriales bacterium]HPD66894.1 squalene/phytoene synthase family protein [Ignavibacteriales bacterium]HPP33763.1 squalene/phytoene synthase family protein [Ignavibacteriales bacterium]